MWTSFVRSFVRTKDIFPHRSDSSCDQCIRREFQHHREISCPACQKPVKKSQLQDKTVEELSCAKETSIRKKVMKEYVFETL